jgi:hypothetical protein
MRLHMQNLTLSRTLGPNESEVTDMEASITRARQQELELIKEKVEDKVAQCPLINWINWLT